MYHNAFRQYVRWNTPRGIHGGMHADAAPDDHEDDDAAPVAAAEPVAAAPQVAVVYPGYTPPPEFWGYNHDQMVLPPPETAWAKYQSDWHDWYAFTVPDGEVEDIPPGIEYDWYERMPDDDTYTQGTWLLKHYGIKVRTQVALSFLGGHYNPLLVIRVDQQPGWTQSSFISHKLSNSLSHRHVSVGYMNDIMAGGIDNWNEKLQVLYSRFHDRDLWLWCSSISGGGTFQLSAAYDPIANDEIVQEFHTTYTNGQGGVIPMHISL